jgi:uncharacterized glyoxalase superfamily protein PhnB
MWSKERTMEFAFDHLFVAAGDFDTSRTFYQQVLGFATDHEWGGAGQPRGAAMRLGHFRIVIAEHHEESGDASWSSGVAPDCPTVHVKCSDIRAMARELEEKRATVVVPLQKAHWGAHWLVIKDPDGNLIAFFEETGNPEN